jgi:hypothetical protein
LGKFKALPCRSNNFASRAPQIYLNGLWEYDGNSRHYADLCQRQDMDEKKSKSQLDEELNEALKETFPGSDAIAIDASGDKPFRPIERRPPEIDKRLVDDLAREVRKSQTRTKAR